MMTYSDLRVLGLIFLFFGGVLNVLMATTGDQILRESLYPVTMAFLVPGVVILSFAIFKSMTRK